MRGRGSMRCKSTANCIPLSWSIASKRPSMTRICTALQWGDEWRVSRTGVLWRA